MSKAPYTTEKWAVIQNIGTGIGEATMQMAVQIGENCGAHLYMLANHFGIGLSENLIKEQTDEIRRVIRRALQHIPAGIGAAMLEDPEILDPIQSAAESAMMGRYHALAGGVDG